MSNPNVIHSTLSFSGRERWANCPASVGLSKGIADDGSPAAAEGTLAHTIAEFYVRQAFELPGAIAGEHPYVEPPFGLDRFEGLLDEALWAETQRWNEELHAGAKAYVDFIRSLIPTGLTHGVDYFVSLEVKVAAKSIDDRLFGTTDLLIWFPKFKHLIVVDYKFGFADVAVMQVVNGKRVFNKQLTAYLVAALDQCTLEAESATIAIFQPRRPSGAPGDSEKLTKEEIAQERESLRSDAIAVSNSDGTTFPGAWCRYCKAAKAGACPQVTEGTQTALDVDAGNRSLIDMPDADVLAMYARRSALKAFFEGIEQKVDLMAKSGHPRIVRETRAGRRMFVPDARNMLIALGLDECLVPGKVSDVAAKIPKDLHEALFTKSRDSVSLKIVDAPNASETAAIFAKYANNA
jgi:hypothetical protein